MAQDGFVLLPQTAIRFWGIPNSELLNYHQVQLPIRSKNDEKFVDFYYMLNKKILSISTSNVVKSSTLSYTAFIAVYPVLIS